MTASPKAPKDLYRCSMRAAKRRIPIQGRTAEERNLNAVLQETWRAGWMHGWRAGNVARKRR